MSNDTSLKIVHLSDSHFRAGDTRVATLVQPLLRAVSASPDRPCHVVLAVTGDVAYSGLSEEYSVAAPIIQEVAQGLGRCLNAPVTIAIVPGNHDCNFERDTAARKALIKAVGTGVDWDPSIPSACTVVQEDFFNFSGNQSKLQLTASALLQQTRIDLPSRAIAIWGINSAWMSQVQEQPGSIWLPVHVFQSEIEKSEPALNILLLHHPFAWLQTAARRSLLLLVDSAFDLVLGGHEHLTESWARDDLAGQKTLVIEGGAFQESGSPSLDGSAFNVVTLDLDTLSVTTSSYEFDGSNYLATSEKSSQIERLSRAVKPYRVLSEKFSAHLRNAGATFRHPKRSGPLELQDIYVSPDLLDMDAAIDAHIVEKAINADVIISSVQSQPHVVIGGAEKSGKSALLRWAYLHLHGLGLTPVRIDGSSIKSAELGRVLKVLNDAYLQQYAVSDVGAWSQLDFSSKALLVDDFDACELNKESRSRLVAELTMHFGVVYITCDDTGLMHAEGPDSEFDGFKRYQLPEFGHRLRDALVTKWLRLGQMAEQEYSAFQLLREQRVRALNMLLGQSFVPSRPIFLLTLLQSMELGAEVAIRGSSLGEYYEYLIRQSLLGANVDPRDLDAVLNYLTELAYFFVGRDRAHLNSRELSEFDANFGTRYALNMKFDSLHRQLYEADVLEEWNDEIRFKYRYVLLFFGARYLARHFSHNEEVAREVRALGRHLAVAKYADLMLFVVHHSNDPAVLDIVLDEASRAFAGVAELRLDQSDIAPINELVVEIPRLALKEEPAEARRERSMRARDERESQHRVASGKNDSELSLASLRDETTDDALDIAQQLAYGLRILAILGQVLRNYYGSLRAERKEQIAAASYALLGRLLRAQINVLIDSKDDLITHVANELERRGWETADRAKTVGSRLVFGIASLIVFLLVKRASEFLGSDKLLPTHEEVSGAVDTPLSRLVGLAITLEYPAVGSSGAPRAVPLDVLDEFNIELKNNLCASVVLRRLVRDYLYMFEVSFKDKQRICDLLGISIQSQRQIQMFSRRKRKGEG